MKFNIETQNNSIQFSKDILKKLYEVKNIIQNIYQEKLHDYLINELKKYSNDQNKSKFLDNVKKAHNANILDNYDFIYLNIIKREVMQEAKLTTLKTILDSNIVDNNINYQEFLSRIYKSSILILSADRTLSIDTLKYLLENQYADLIPLKIFFFFFNSFYQIYFNKIDNQEVAFRIVL